MTWTPDPELRAARLAIGLDPDTGERLALETAVGKAKGKEKGNAKDRATNLGEKQADALIRLAMAKANFWHSTDSTAFADIRVEKHRETWPVRSRKFKLWLAGQYYENCRSAPNSEAVQSALNILEGKARFEGPEFPVSVRIAAGDGKVYIDLGTRDWSAVEIDADGWRIVHEPPVRFRRSKGTLPLPLPRPDGDVNALRPFLNVNSSEDFALVIAYLLATLRGSGPFPILVLTGEHGTAKSTLARISERSAIQIARRCARCRARIWICSFPPTMDTYSPLTMSRACPLGCQIYWPGLRRAEDLVRGNFILTVKNCCSTQCDRSYLNGIEDFVTRGDLADRAITLTLMEIRDDKRRDEESFWAEFDRVAPLILGGLLDAVAHGLKKLPDVSLDRKPRMADFAKWVVACEGKLPWTAGTFLRAYEGNRADAVEAILESDAVVVALRTVLTEHKEWKGTAGGLLKALNTAVADEKYKAKDWPKSPRGMAGALRRNAPGLRKLGYIWAYHPRNAAVSSIPYDLNFGNARLVP